jgi:hypothetical protein
MTTCAINSPIRPENRLRLFSLQPPVYFAITVP